MADFTNIKHFKPTEFTNPDAMQQDVVDKLDALRDIFPFPVEINSSWRSPEHNAQVNGAPHSAHMAGEAIDCKVQSGAYIYDFLAAAFKVGFTGIGVEKLNGVPTGFVHVECRAWAARAVWTYPPGGGH